MNRRYPPLRRLSESSDLEGIAGRGSELLRRVPAPRLPSAREAALIEERLAELTQPGHPRRTGSVVLPVMLSAAAVLAAVFCLGRAVGRFATPSLAGGANQPGSSSDAADATGGLAHRPTGAGDFEQLDEGRIDVRAEAATRSIRTPLGTLIVEAHGRARIEIRRGRLAVAMFEGAATMQWSDGGSVQLRAPAVLSSEGPQDGPPAPEAPAPPPGGRGAPVPVPGPRSEPSSPTPSASPEPLHGRPEPLHGRPEPLHGRPEPLHGRPEPLHARPEPLHARPEPLHAPRPPSLPASNERRPAAASPLVLPPGAPAAAAPTSQRAIPAPATRGSPTPMPAPLAPTAVASPMAQELDLLGAALRCQRTAHDPACALKNADAYLRWFPSGALASEARRIAVAAQLQLGERKAALRALGRWPIERDPDLRLIRAELLRGAGRCTEALSDYTTLLASPPVAPATLLGTAACEAGVGQRERARSHAQQLLDAHPSASQSAAAREILRAL